MEKNGLFTAWLFVLFVSSFYRCGAVTRTRHDHALEANPTVPFVGAPERLRDYFGYQRPSVGSLLF